MVMVCDIVLTGWVFVLTVRTDYSQSSLDQPIMKLQDQGVWMVTRDHKENYYNGEPGFIYTLKLK